METRDVEIFTAVDDYTPARAHSQRRYHTGRRNQPRRRVTARQSTKSAVQNTTVDITTDDTSVHNSYVPSDVTHHDAAARNLTPAPVDDPTPARAHSQRRYHTGRRNDPIPAATATNANVGRADGPFSEVSGDNIATSDSARDNGTQQPLATNRQLHKRFLETTSPLQTELVVLYLRFLETTLPLQTVPVTTVLNNLWPRHRQQKNFFFF